MYYDAVVFVKTAFWICLFLPLDSLSGGVKIQKILRSNYKYEVTANEFDDNIKIIERQFATLSYVFIELIYFIKDQQLSYGWQYPSKFFIVAILLLQ